MFPRDRTRDSRHKQMYRTLLLNIRKHFFYCECNLSLMTLLKEIVKSPSLATFESNLVMVTGNFL